MLNRVSGYMAREKVRSRMRAAFSRGAATAAARLLDPHDPVSWEFSAFSQNGEDGILDYLSRHVRDPTRTFAEIGAADGIDNNTAWLAYARKFRGTMIDGNPDAANTAQLATSLGSIVTKYLTSFVTLDNAEDVLDSFPTMSPDVFSFDIDGNDYHVVKKYLDSGLRPAIVIVEYNSAYEPERSVTIPYQPRFDITKGHPSHLYYGASVKAWRCLLESRSYAFVTSDSNGVNAIFADENRFDSNFLSGLKGLPFAENFYQAHKLGTDWEGQYDLIQSLPLDPVD